MGTSFGLIGVLLSENGSLETVEAGVPVALTSDCGDCPGRALAGEELARIEFSSEVIAATLCSRSMPMNMLNCSISRKLGRALVSDNP